MNRKHFGGLLVLTIAISTLLSARLPAQQGNITPLSNTQGPCVAINVTSKQGKMTTGYVSFSGMTSQQFSNTFMVTWDCTSSVNPNPACSVCYMGMLYSAPNSQNPKYNWTYITGANFNPDSYACNSKGNKLILEFRCPPKFPAANSGPLQVGQTYRVVSYIQAFDPEIGNCWQQGLNAPAGFDTFTPTSFSTF